MHLNVRPFRGAAHSVRHESLCYFTLNHMSNSNFHKIAGNTSNEVNQLKKCAFDIEMQGHVTCKGYTVMSLCVSGALETQTIIYNSHLIYFKPELLHSSMRSSSRPRPHGVAAFTETGTKKGVGHVCPRDHRDWFMQMSSGDSGPQY